MTRRRVVVRGYVQGVFFRETTRRIAEQQRVSGWVRNAPDGTVEAVFEGPSERVESMVRWCGRGPRDAQVAGVDVRWEEPSGEKGFSVR